MQEEVKKSFGIDMNIPAEMQCQQEGQETSSGFRTMQDSGYAEPHPDESEVSEERRGKEILMLFTAQ